MTLFALTPSTLEDIPLLRHHLRVERDVAAPAARVFEVLAAGEGQRRWAAGYRSTRWFGAGPPGPGRVRDIRLHWITVRERFLAWEPGERFAFGADAMSVPLARQMIEDISMEPLGGGRCRLVWQVHLTPSVALTPFGVRLVDRVFAPMFAGFADGLADYAQCHGSGTKSL